MISSCAENLQSSFTIAKETADYNPFAVPFYLKVGISFITVLK